MSGVDVSEVRAHMVAAADGLLAALSDTVICEHIHTPYGDVAHTLPRQTLTAMAYAEGVIRTLATTILPPDPPEELTPWPAAARKAEADARAAGGRRRAGEAVRDSKGRFLPAGTEEA